ncbi:MAG: hypothetical protein U0414_12775 [Polyangiaceae bacterium]
MTLATTRPPYAVHRPSDVEGLWLELAPSSAPLVSPIVCGAFRVSRSNRLLSRPFHRSIAVVLQRGLRSAVFAPFADLVLFSDDEVETPRGFEGAFSFDVEAALADQPLGDSRHGTVLAFALLGVFASNVLEIVGTRRR